MTSGTEPALDVVIKNVRVVKDDPDRVAVPRANAADPVPEIYSVPPATPLHRPVVDSENDGVTLSQRHDLSPRLHPRTLFGHDELTTGEVSSGFGQQDGNLEGEHVLAVEVLMQAVVVVRSILEQERSRLALPGLVTAGDKVGVLVRIAHVDAHGLVPANGFRRQVRV